MIKNTVTTSDLFKLEPSLSEYLLTNQVDFDELINQGFQLTLLDLRNKGFDLRLLNTPLYIENSGGSLSTPYTSSVTNKDYINRNLLTVTVEYKNSGIYSVYLYGSNDSSSVTNLVTSFSIDNDSDSIINTVLTTFYNYYKVQILNSNNYSLQTTIYLHENIYYYMIMYKSLSLIYKSLTRLAQKGNYNDKFLEYDHLYSNLLENGFFSYDSNQDGEINEYESKANTNVLRIRL